jgi:hypothetical protein
MLQEMVVRTKYTESLTPYLHPGGNDGIQAPWQHVPLYLPPGDDGETHIPRDHLCLYLHLGYDDGSRLLGNTYPSTFLQEMV